MDEVSSCEGARCGLRFDINSIKGSKVVVLFMFSRYTANRHKIIVPHHTTRLQTSNPYESSMVC